MSCRMKFFQFCSHSIILYLVYLILLANSGMELTGLNPPVKIYGKELSAVRLTASGYVLGGGAKTRGSNPV